MIEEVGVGARDVGRPILWFTVSDGDSGGALQVMELTDSRAQELLKAVYEVHSLNGRMCRVTVNDGIVRFARLLKGPRA